MTNAILYGGQRTGRSTLGAVPWWYATVETRLDEHAAWLLLRGRDPELQVTRAGTVRDITLTLPQNETPPIRTFAYDLSDPRAACELLLLARAGNVRLDILALPGAESVPVVLRTVSITLPRTLAQDLEACTTEALRDLTGGHAELLDSVLRQDTIRDLSVRQFVNAETDKAYDLVHTIDVVNEARRKPTAGDKAVQHASARLADARRRRTDLRLAREDTAKAENAVARAEEALRKAVEQPSPAPLCFSRSCKRAAGLRARHDCCPLLHA